MFRNEIVGLACLENVVESCLMRKATGRNDASSWYPDASWTQSPTVAEGIEETVMVREVLSGLLPSRRRAIALGIGRHRFWMREIACQGCTVDEVIASTRLSLDHYLSLPREEVYYDMVALQREEHATVQLYWVERQYIDALVAVFRETGHLRSLEAIAPLCYGLDSLLRHCAKDLLPLSLLAMQQQLPVLSFHPVAGYGGSLPLRLDHQQQPKIDMGSLGAKMAEASALPLRSLSFQAFPQPLPGTLQQSFASVLPGQAPLADVGLEVVNWGQCAAMVACNDYPAPIFHHGRRRVSGTVRKRFTLTLMLMVLLVAFGAAAFIGWQVRSLKSESERLQADVHRLEQKLAPLLVAEKELLEKKKYLEDVRSFRSDPGKLLDAMKNLAEQTPATTWLQGLQISEQRVTVVAVGKGAADILDIWSRVPQLSQGRFVSPVNKDRDGLEHFRTEFLLQKEE